MGKRKAYMGKVKEMREFNGGNVVVANDVIDMIIATAAKKVESVEQVRGFDHRSGKLRHNYKKDLITEVDDNRLYTQLMIHVAPDASVTEVAHNVQEAVIERVESMLGLVCEQVNVICI